LGEPSTERTKKSKKKRTKKKGERCIRREPEATGVWGVCRRLLQVWRRVEENSGGMGTKLGKRGRTPGDTTNAMIGKGGVESEPKKKKRIVEPVTDCGERTLLKSGGERNNAYRTSSRGAGKHKLGGGVQTKSRGLGQIEGHQKGAKTSYAYKHW